MSWTRPINRLLLLRQSRSCLLIGIVRASDVRLSLNWNCLDNWFRRLPINWICLDNCLRGLSNNSKWWSNCCLVLSNNWNCPDKLFWSLSINWNCPDNWFQRLSINWNCLNNWWLVLWINWNCLNNWFRVTYRTWIEIVGTTVGTTVFGDRPLIGIIYPDNRVLEGCCLTTGSYYCRVQLFDLVSAQYRAATVALTRWRSSLYTQ